MDTPEPSRGPGLLEPDVAEPVQVAPPVVAIVVTGLGAPDDAAGGGSGLDATVRSLAGQEYASLSVLVVATDPDRDPTERVAEAMPHAFVLRRPGGEPFAVAANEASSAIEGATFLFFCHDGVVLEPDVVGVMVEEAYRSNAGIVGPKVVDRDRPEVLLEVGMAVDHYGIPYNGVEPGEVDQEQHDAVRDVFYVPHDALLVRADLFAEIGGFDAALAPGAADLDLCWRARLAGARVMVAPEARVHQRRPAGAVPGIGATAAELRVQTADRLRVLLKAYSGLALVWVVPVAWFLDALDSVGLVFGRQFGRAGALWRGWWDTLRGLRGVLRDRRAVQGLRRVPDGEVRDLMVRGSARARNLWTHRFHGEDRIQDVTYRTRAAVGEARGRLRRPSVVAWIVLVAALLVGARDLVLSGVPQVGSLLAWPSTGDLFSAFSSTWRSVLLGAPVAGPSAFGMMAAGSGLLLGNPGLARTVVVVGALPLGAWGAARLIRRQSPSWIPSLATAVAYVANPVARNAVAEGLLGPLVCFALAPFVLAALLRAAAPGEGAGRRTRGVLGMFALAAVATAVWPPAVLLAPVFGAAWLLAVPFTGGLRPALRVVVVAVLGSAGAFALLLPWTATWFSADAAALGLLPREATPFAELVAFHTGPAGAGLLPWGIVVAGAAGLLVVTGDRFAWVARAWVLVLVSYALAWVPARLDPERAVVAVEGVLVPAALGLALAVGLGAAAFLDDLRQVHFGWRQPVVLVAAVALGLAALGVVPDLRSGRLGLPARDWAGALAWTRQTVPEGDFRILWLGDPEVLPLDPKVVDGVGYGLTADGPGDARVLWAPGPSAADDRLGAAIGDVAAARTTRFGHLVGAMGVRYVALIDRAAPGDAQHGAPDPRLTAALRDQLDLAVLRAEPGITLYENEAWIPARATVTDSDLGDLRDADPARLEVPGAEAVTGPLGGSDPAGPGALLYAEAYDDRWEATVAGDSTTLPHHRTFGWANGYELPAGEPSSVELRFDGGPGRGIFVTLEVLAWLLLAAAWWRSRRRRPGAGADDREATA